MKDYFPLPETLVTKQYLDERLTEGFASLEHRITEKLTWRMITVLRAWTVIATSLFAFMSRL